MITQARFDILDLWEKFSNRQWAVALLLSAGRLSLCRPYKLMPQPLCGLRAAPLFLHLPVFPRRLPPSPPPGLARARGVAVREGGSTGGRGGEINTARATRERSERQIDLIISRKEKIQIKTTPSAPPPLPSPPPAIHHRTLLHPLIGVLPCLKQTNASGVLRTYVLLFLPQHINVWFFVNLTTSDDMTRRDYAEQK